MSQAITHMMQGMLNNMFTTWVLLLIGPVVFLSSTILARAIEFVYKESRYRTFVLRQYVGDISWLLPLSKKESEFNLTHIALMASLLVLLSLIIMSSMRYSKYIDLQTKKYRDLYLQEKKEKK